MRKNILQKFYPIYIGLLIGVPIWGVTYFSMEEKWHGVFWFMMCIYATFIVIQQIKWNKK